MKRCILIWIETGLVLCVLAGVANRTIAQVISGGYHAVMLPKYNGYGGYPGALAGGYPRIAGYDIVWTGWVGPLPPLPGGQPEIFRFDGTHCVQVTNNIHPLGNRYVSVSPLRRIVYIGDTGTTNDLFMYDLALGSATQLTFSGARWNMVVTDFHDDAATPRVTIESMDQWLGGPWPPTWISLDLWDGTQVLPLDCRTFNHGSQVGLQQVVWHASNVLGSNYNIFLYDIASKTTSQLTAASSTWSWRDPQLDGSFLVWWGTDYTSNTQITLCDLSQGIHYRHPVAARNSFVTPLVTNAREHVIWSWPDAGGASDEIWHHEHTPPFTSTVQIFPNATCPPGTVSWIDTSYPFAAFAIHMPGGGPYDIYVYDLVNRGPLQHVGTGLSSAPVWVQVSAVQVPSYGAVPVVIWEENLGGPNQQAYLATRPQCGCPTADFDDDCTVDGTDLAIMGVHWGQPNHCDLNGDNIVNFADLVLLTGQWLQCNIQPAIYCGMGISFPCP